MFFLLQLGSKIVLESFTVEYSMSLREDEAKQVSDIATVVFSFVSSFLIFICCCLCCSSLIVVRLLFRSVDHIICLGYQTRVWTNCRLPGRALWLPGSDNSGWYDLRRWFIVIFILHQSLPPLRYIRCYLGPGNVFELLLQPCHRLKILPETSVPG